MSATANLPAFPVPANATIQGVNRRDWFAAMALNGVVTQGLEIMGDRVVSEEERIMMLAVRSYAFADAMLQLSDAHQVDQAASV